MVERKGNFSGTHFLVLVALKPEGEGDGGGGRRQGCRARLPLEDLRPRGCRAAPAGAGQAGRSHRRRAWGSIRAGGHGLLAGAW